tara:strand:+ start:2606 stop:2944 length:339 start_codon:yes stop_codon:yes gene_type:complete
MELTGKTLKDFWIWYLLPEQRKTYKTSSLRGVDNVAKIRFLAMSFTERYGVYVDFFDSVGVYCSLSTMDGTDFWYDFSDGNEITEDSDVIITRQEARASAIEKANEIYNLNQ